MWLARVGSLWLLGLVALATSPRVAGAYAVRPAASFDEMAGHADIVIKAEVVSLSPVADPWFDKLSGFAPYAARIRVISVLDGSSSLKGAELSFHHYGKAPSKVGFGYSPQHYELKAGRTYIFFAKAGDGPDTYRQLWKRHRAKHDQGVLLCANDRRHRGTSIRAAYWSELTSLLKSRRRADVRYALGQLDSMSGGRRVALSHFGRKQVLLKVAPLVLAKDRQIAATAIEVLASRNPYSSERFAPGWLATVGQGHIPGLAKWDPSEINLGGRLHWKVLVSAAKSRRHPGNRALAIRALGRSKYPRLLGWVKRWLRDTNPEVRAAAAVVMADYPGRITPAMVERLSSDPSARVRRSTAYMIGFAQKTRHLAVLVRLLHDKDGKTRAAAAVSLLSFPLTASDKFLEANLGTSEYRALFVNALAGKDPTPYLATLTEIVKKNPKPGHWWGGKVPWATSWELLFFHVQKQPESALRRGNLDVVLDALESPGAGYYSSSEPRDLYALYLQKGLVARAKSFRVAANKKASFNLDYYFEMVRKNPDTYQRR